MIGVPILLLGVLGYYTFKASIYSDIQEEISVIAQDWHLITENQIERHAQLLRREEVLQRKRLIAITRDAKLFITHAVDNAHILEETFDSLASIEIGKSGYVYVIQGTGRYFLSKDKLQDGQNILDRKNKNGERYIARLIERARQLDEGEFFTTILQLPDDAAERELLSAVTYFEPLDLVIGAASFLTDFQSTELEAVLKDELRMQMASRSIQNSGYIWAIDSNGEYILSKDHLRDGENLLYILNDKGVPVVQNILDSAVHERVSIVEESWRDIGEDHPRNRLSAIVHIPEWDWIIGVSAYYDDFFGILVSIRIGIIVAVIIATLLSSILTYVFSLYLRPISERLKRAKLDMRKFELAVNSAAEGISIIGQYGDIFYVNKAWEDLTGYTLEDVVDVNGEILVKDLTDEKIRNEARNAMDKGKSYSSEEFIFRRKDGTHFNAEVKIAPVEQEEGEESQIFVCIMTDVTSRKRQDAAKTEFVVLASHQLRTPLTVIKWSLQRFLKKSTDRQNNGPIQMVESALDSAKNMNELIEGMLTIAKIEAGKISPNYSSIVLKGFLEHIKRTCTQAAKKKPPSIRIECPENLSIKTDENLFSQVCINLISNAIKYTPRGGKITIVVYEIKGNIYISIADTGCGIPLSEQKKMFTKFFRATNAIAIMPDGSGLGMYLAHIVTNLLHGTLSFTSIENEGSKFIVTIPQLPTNDEGNTANAV